MKITIERHGFKQSRKADHSALVVVGAVMALLMLSGCATSNVGGTSDEDHYNNNTGYPAVGGRPMH